MNEHDRQDLRKARSLAGWGFIGVFLPLLGWILSGLSLSTSNHLDPQNEKATKAVKSVRSLAKTGIFVTTLAFVIYSGLGIWAYSQAQAESKRQLDAQALQEKNEKAAQEAEADLNRFTLNQCLDTAYKNHKSAWDADVAYLQRTDGRLPEMYSQKHESNYANAKDECYRRAEIGN